MIFRELFIWFWFEKFKCWEDPIMYRVCHFICFCDPVLLYWDKLQVQNRFWLTLFVFELYLTYNSKILSPHRVLWRVFYFLNFEFLKSCIFLRRIQQNNKIFDKAHCFLDRNRSLLWLHQKKFFFCAFENIFTYIFILINK